MNMAQWMESPTVTYFIIFVLTTWIYRKVFAQKRRLPLLKAALVYVMLALGSIMLNFFQIAVKLPIIPALLVAVAMMAIVRIRSALTAARASSRDN